MTSAGGVGLSSITVSPLYKSSQSVSHQSICYAENEHMLSVNGKESSIVLDLEPNRIQLGPCKRTFKAPDPHGFIVKLLKFKSKQMRNPNSHIDSNIGGVSIDVFNETTTCPLNIVSYSFIYYYIFYSACCLHIYCYFCFFLNAKKKKKFTATILYYIDSFSAYMNAGRAHIFFSSSLLLISFYVNKIYSRLNISR